MIQNAIILHSTMGSPDFNWFRWMQTEFEARGLQVWLPQLPHPERPSLRQEADFVHENCPFAITEETLIVGHSSGAILALILAQENHVPVGAMVCVSVLHDNSLNWDANSKLFDVDFDWLSIIERAKPLFIHSDNDPYVPLSQAQYVADHCHAELVLVPGQGHFSLEQSPDYKAFPKLLEIMQQKGTLA